MRIRPGTFRSRNSLKVSRSGVSPPIVTKATLIEKRSHAASSSSRTDTTFVPALGSFERNSARSPGSESASPSTNDVASALMSMSLSGSRAESETVSETKEKAAVESNGVIGRGD